MLMLSVVIPSVRIKSLMLNVCKQNVIMLNVVAPVCSFISDKTMKNVTFQLVVLLRYYFELTLMEIS
jgi:hypothetical protein